MKYIYVGKIVNTHGIKGELRIISDFEHKDYIFKNGITLYIGDEKEKVKITGYRQHKNYDMVTLEGYNDINQVLRFKTKKVYVIREEINELNNIIIKDDIIGLDLYLNEKRIGIVTDIYNSGSNNSVIEIKDGEKKYLVPYNKDLISNIDLSKKIIIFKGGIVDA